MNIIHCADIHLGSRMDSALPKNLASERKAELRATFIRMLDYAKAHEVSAILLSGDVFDDALPKRKDKEFFYDAVRANPEVDFLYLRGNHDRLESYTVTDLPNLKTFTDSFTTYTYGNLDITGIECTENNALSMYAALKLNPDRLNIVMMHGQVTSHSEIDCVNLSELRGKYIDYLALGHLHSYRKEKLDERGYYAYSGCLEGRGFDETGEKGFVLLRVEDTIESEFVPFAKRTVAEYTVSLTGTDSVYAAAQKVRAENTASQDDLLRVILTGEVPYDNEMLATDMTKYLETDAYFVSVKDKTVRQYDALEYQNSLSLRGEFIRTVLADESYTQDEKQKIIALGLRALDGRELEA